MLILNHIILTRRYYYPDLTISMDEILVTIYIEKLKLININSLPLDNCLM